MNTQVLVSIQLVLVLALLIVTILATHRNSRELPQDPGQPLARWRVRMIVLLVLGLFVACLQVLITLFIFSPTFRGV